MAIQTVLRIFLLLFIFVFPKHTAAGSLTEATKTNSTELVQNKDDLLLLVSTLNGSLICVENLSGLIKWKLKEEPAVKVPVDTSRSLIPLFLPDPKDGSLYMLGETENDALRKLPYTIPQLVSSSPCRSSDGLFYTGKKVDTWFSVDPKSGHKQEVFSYDREGKTCPLSESDPIFIGRTEYNIIMVDIREKNKSWNITYYDYSSKVMETEHYSNYGQLHFTASSSGQIVTVDRRDGTLLWEHDFGSPVVALYFLNNEGLVSVPFTSVGEETLQHIIEQSASHHGSSVKLYPSLYIGEHHYGLYALPSLIDQHTAAINPLLMGIPLLEGPHHLSSDVLHKRQIPLPGDNVKISSSFYFNVPVTYQSLPKEGPFILLGHYKMPDNGYGIPQIAGRSDPIIYSSVKSDIRNSSGHLIIQKNGSFAIIQEATKDKNESQFSKSNSASFWDSFPYIYDIFKSSYNLTKIWLSQQENQLLKLMVVVLGGLIVILFYLRIQDANKYSSDSSRGSTKYFLDSSDASDYAVPEDLGNGMIRIGKITFNVENIIGKGCEGTFVYRGEFECRAVAVKRLLPECFTLADREVTLLQESDHHPHVIRYFCTERDRLFCYIALELCSATLQDYVEGRYQGNKIERRDLLHQATLGLEHLHSLKIVHRDIKPHNVLISLPSNNGQVRAMISDFGLCKKLKVGCHSFSRNSGIAGTDGWIAPEMLKEGMQTTCAVDIFSLGCVFYYVLTNGKHPFGDELRRQSNIVNGEYGIHDLEEDKNILEYSLIKLMISPNPSDRPPASAICIHPIFWDPSRILTFFQDVSDRVEKDNIESRVLQILELNTENVVKTDWRNHIDPEVAQDLRKYRNYTGSSVRDLLRALRNKKHHYRELSEAAQRSLGDIPNNFVDYWTQRFPMLLLHTWLAMQCIRTEPIFSQFYHPSYIFDNPLVSYNPEKPEQIYHWKNLVTGSEIPKGQVSSKLSYMQTSSKLNRNSDESCIKRTSSTPVWRLEQNNYIEESTDCNVSNLYKVNERRSIPSDGNANVITHVKSKNWFKDKSNNKAKKSPRKKTSETPLVWSLPPCPE